jgi:hypothetical protein
MNNIENIYTTIETESETENTDTDTDTDTDSYSDTNTETKTKTNTYTETETIMSQLKKDFKLKRNDYDKSAGYHTTHELTEFDEIISDILPVNINNLIIFEVTLEIHTTEHDGYCSPFDGLNTIIDPKKNGLKTIQIVAKNNEELFEKCQRLQYVTTCYNSSSRKIFDFFSGYCTLLCWCKVIKIV